MNQKFFSENYYIFAFISTSRLVSFVECSSWFDVILIYHCVTLQLHEGTLTRVTISKTLRHHTHCTDTLLFITLLNHIYD